MTTDPTTATPAIPAGLTVRPEPCFYIEVRGQRRWSEYDEMEGGSSHHFTVAEAEERVLTVIRKRNELLDITEPALQLRVSKFAKPCSVITCTECDTTFDTEGEGYTVHWPGAVDEVIKGAESIDWKVIDGRLVCSFEDCRCKLEGHTWGEVLTVGAIGDQVRQWCMVCSASRPVTEVELP